MGLFGAFWGFGITGSWGFRVFGALGCQVFGVGGFSVFGCAACGLGASWKAEGCL